MGAVWFVQLNYVIVSFEFVATAPVWGQLDLISNLLCCIYWNCYVMPAVFTTAPITFVTVRPHLRLWVGCGDFPLSFLLILIALAQFSYVAAVSRSDLDNYSMFFLVPFERYQQKGRVCDTRAAYVNEQSRGQTRQISRGHLPLCEMQQEFTFVLLWFTGDQKDKAHSSLKKMSMTSSGKCLSG